MSEKALETTVEPTPEATQEPTPEATPTAASPAAATPSPSDEPLPPQDESEDTDEVYPGSDDTSMFIPYIEQSVSEESASSKTSKDTWRIRLDRMTDAEFLEYMAELETEVRHLKLENDMFYTYLKENDPSLLEGIDIFLQATLACKDSGTCISASSLIHRRKRMSGYSAFSMISVLEDKGPKVNLTHKSEMVLKAIEEKQTALNEFVRRSHVTRRKLLCELEEFKIREGDLQEDIAVFELYVVTEGLDPLTQRIPAEKWLKYMDDWLKASNLVIEKLRLRTTYIKVQYQKVSTILESRKELRENLHAVDFDKLRIENKNFSKELDQKSTYMMELKKMVGEANRVLTLHKKYLNESLAEYEELKQNLEQCQEDIIVLEKIIDAVDEEAEKARSKYDKMMNIREQYKVPDVMVYMNLKKQLAEIHRVTKVHTRKKNVLDISLHASLREMMNITGSRVVNPDWWKEPIVEDEFEQQLTDIFPDTSFLVGPVQDEGVDERSVRVPVKSKKRNIANVIREVKKKSSQGAKPSEHTLISGRASANEERNMRVSEMIAKINDDRIRRAHKENLVACDAFLHQLNKFT